MNWKSDGKYLTWMGIFFAAIYFMPAGSPRFDNAVDESLLLLQSYAREHVIFCLVPAFFIAGAMARFLNQNSVIRYLGPGANRFVAYGLSSVSGSILAVCSCTVLPLFAGIYRVGAGLGPAAAFLYSGPAINVMAIIVTARILGPELGTVRAVGAVAFSLLIGLAMHMVYRREEKERSGVNMVLPEDENARPLGHQVTLFLLMIVILIFANWGASSEGLWHQVWLHKWKITGATALLLALVLVRWFGLSALKTAAAAALTVLVALMFRNSPEAGFLTGILVLSFLTATGNEELKGWFDETWGFTRQIMPLLLMGVLAAGFFLGRPGHEGIIPGSIITEWLGGNSPGANFFASFAGAFMYFATLTEVPILHGLLGSGMGKGPALALLLAGPALSLPNMLVIRSVLGTKKTLVYSLLVIVMSTAAGIIYGSF